MEMNDVVSWMVGDRIRKFFLRMDCPASEWMFDREREMERLAESLLGYCELRIEKLF